MQIRFQWVNETKRMKRVEASRLTLKLCPVPDRADLSGVRKGIKWEAEPAHVLAMQKLYEAVWWQIARRSHSRADCLASLAVCVFVLPHLIRIFMHALHCHPGERVTACCLLCLPCLLPAASCHLRNQHNCAAHQARGGTAPAAFAALFSPDGSNQTYCTTTTAATKGAATGAGASSGEQRVPVASGNAVLHLHK